MSGGESSNSTLQKSTEESQPPMYSMRLASTSDGTAVYKTIGSNSSAPHQGADGGSDGPSPSTMQQGLGASMGEPLKRKRGRPRKYGPDGAMAFAMGATTRSAPAPPSSGGFSPSPSVAAMASTEVAKKSRGRPPGSSKKQQMEALGSAGAGFVPHVITVNTGEDVSSKIMSFSQHGTRAVCILSANGAISNMTLRQAAISGGSMTYEGRFEILSLSGSFLLSESGGQRSRTGGLSVSLAGPDGRVLGGGVAGPLVAASPVQVVMGSFILKDKTDVSPSDVASAPGTFGASCGTTGTSSPPSRGTMSESSGGPGSPLNQGTGMWNNNHQGLSNMAWK